MPAAHRGRTLTNPARKIVRFLVFCLGGLIPLTVAGAVDRYDYDPLGRLIRWVDGAGKATDYVYDAVGNILSVGEGGALTQLTIDSVSPATLRCSETATVVVTGQGLGGSRLTVHAGDVTAANFTATANRVEWLLKPGADCQPGTKAFTLSSAAGNADFSIQLGPVLPTMQIVPVPLAVPPDGVGRSFSIVLSNPDIYSHTITLSSANSSIASVSPATLAIPAGGTEVRATVAGLSTGTTSILLTSPTLAPASAPIFVTGEYVGINISRSTLLGVLKSAADEPPPGLAFGPLTASPVGVTRGGPMITGIRPGNVAVGSDAVELVVSGSGLQDVTGARISPATGLTMGAPSAATDGRSLTLPLSVAADAPLGMRQLVLSGPAGDYPAATPTADRFNVTLRSPEIASIEPIAARPGDTVTLTIRGGNLLGATQVVMTPGANIAIAANPTVNAEGTLLSASKTIQILPDRSS